MNKLLIVEPETGMVFDISEKTLYLVNPEDSPEFLTQEEKNEFIKKYPDAVGQKINFETMREYLNILFPEN